MDRVALRLRILATSLEKQGLSLTDSIGEMLARGGMVQLTPSRGIHVCRPVPNALASRHSHVRIASRLLCSSTTTTASASVPGSAAPAAGIASIAEKQPATPLGTVANNFSSQTVNIDNKKKSNEKVSAVPTSDPQVKASTLDLWYDFLRVIHASGDFENTSKSCELLIQQHDDVKAALLTFSRRRPDILFSLPSLEVAALAEAELLPRDRPDRKLRNADRRLKDTFVTGRAAGGAAAGAAAGGEGGAAGGQHASLQDFMRVVWDWAAAPQTTVDSAAPALTPVLRHLLSCLRSLAAAEPDPAAQQRAAAMPLATPSAAELAERAAGHLSAEERRKARDSAYAERRHQLRLRAASEGGAVLEAGDWFCSNCGGTNWRDRKRCFRCAAPADISANSIVSPQDIAQLYGDKP
ncbi:hypothetical protein Agub_g250, partial [Astrephomene gubernaculifera]